MMRLGAARGPERERALVACAAAVRRGELVLIPTEQVYALATDAFHRHGRSALRTVKGYDPNVSIPVLVSSRTMVRGIAQPSPIAERLMEAFWPGGLTLVLPSQPTLSWDGGDAVAVRMPIHPFTLALVERTGPLAVTAANAPGTDPPVTIEAAVLGLADQVTVGIDCGPCPDDGDPSTILDLTGDTPVLVREASLSRAAMAAVLPELGPDA